MIAQLHSDADVVVIGGGTAGTVAALQAARAGASTLLIELGSQFGGTMTTGGVNFPGLFHAWGKQVIAGIGWELVQRAVALEGGTLPDFSTPPAHHWEQQVRLNASLFACLAEEACLEAGVHLCYYELPVAARPLPDGWELEIAGKGQHRTVRCRELIDCTGDADVVGLLGLPRRKEAERQPGTLTFRLEGYDAESLDADLVQRRYQAALAAGQLLPGDFAHANGHFLNFLRGGGTNCQHVLAIEADTAAGKTDANIRGRQSLLRLLRFIRTLPGCEQARVAQMQPETGIRETCRIVGEATITGDAYADGLVPADAVCFAFYPIDLHTEAGVVPRPLQAGAVPGVPFGALIPRGSDRLLVAGRCLSSDRAANSALRVQATCMATGQAAGAAAALGAAQGIPSRSVPVDAIKSLLRAHGAITP